MKRALNNHFKLSNPCVFKKDFCINCHSRFMMMRPSLKKVIITKHFIRDLKNKDEMDSIIRDILDCVNFEHTELHKFEEEIYGTLIFRAKKKDKHIVYCVDKKLRIIFLRAIRHFTEYKRFLDNRRELQHIVEEIKNLK